MIYKHLGPVLKCIVSKKVPFFGTKQNRSQMFIMFLHFSRRYSKIMKKLKITGLAIYESKGAPGIHKEKLRLEADRGIEGDMYARGGDRQLTIADTRLETCPEELVIGKLCGRKFKANILADNILEADISAGDVFAVGDAVRQLKKNVFRIPAK